MGNSQVELGLSVVPTVDGLGTTIRLVRRAEVLGFDLVGVQDHPYQRNFVDAFGLIGHLLAHTERIRAFPDVANLPLRPPAVLAKLATTLDFLSSGRFELGLGAGGYLDPIRAMGGPNYTPAQSLDALREAVQVIRKVWSTNRSVSFDGDYYHLDNYRPGPAAPHPIGIWLGARGPRMLRLTGEVADGWVPSLFGNTTPQELGQLGKAVSDAAEASGRSPAAVRHIWNVPTGIAEGDMARLADHLEEWVERFGVTGFVFWLSDGAEERELDDLAAAVLARFKQTPTSE